MEKINFNITKSDNIVGGEEMENDKNMQKTMKQ